MSRSNISKYKNQYQLSRRIPNNIAKAVRKNCGFGCAVCGSIPYQYHHFDPPFEKAREHKAEGIILLCGSCHDKVHHNLLSDITIKKAAETPNCIEQGFSHFSFDVGEQFPEVLFGNSTFTGNSTIIRAFGKRLFAIDKPEEAGGPFRISAMFYDREGNETCKIKYNEWQALATNWDIACIRNEFTIFQEDLEIALKVHSNPPQQLVIDRLDMFYNGFRIFISKDGKTTTYLPDGTKWFTLDGAIIAGNREAVVLN